jgi:hypothetical protein
MDTTTQDYANFQYRNLIPTRFQKDSGVSSHNFLVRTPWHRPYQYAELPDGTIRQFDSSALCQVECDGKLTPLLVRQTATPRLFEATLFVGKLLFESKRIQKYLLAYKAYECLESNRDQALSSVRHSLTHAEIALTHPNTVGALNQLFGSKKIEFDVHCHVRVFYEQLGKLMIVVDRLLHHQLSENVEKTYAIPADVKLLLDWQVKT